MPLGSGIFVKGELKDNNNLIMNVGSNICVEKTVDEGKETISKQLNDISGVFEQLQIEIQRTTERLQELQNEFKDLKEEELGE